MSSRRTTAVLSNNHRFTQTEQLHEPEAKVQQEDGHGLGPLVRPPRKRERNRSRLESRNTGMRYRNGQNSAAIIIGLQCNMSLTHQHRESPSGHQQPSRAARNRQLNPQHRPLRCLWPFHEVTVGAQPPRLTSAETPKFDHAWQCAKLRSLYSFQNRISIRQ